MSAGQVYALNESDRAWFQKMVDWFRRRHPPRPPFVPDPPELEGPWVAVVLTPVGGIGKMWDSVAPKYNGTGTPFNSVEGTGTGTGVGQEGDRPGSADCDEYVLEHGTPGGGKYLTRPRMRKTGRQITVYNLSNVDVNGNQFVTAVRDSSGDWYVAWPGLLFNSNC